MNKTYSIPDSNLPALKTKIEKLARKAEKLGLGQITLDITGHHDQGFCRNREGDTVKCDLEHATSVVRYHHVEIEGETPHLAGWEFCATLQHLVADGEVINMLRTSPTFVGELPAKFRTASPENCDHCQKVIKSRKETFIVRDGTGQFKQVGRNCTQDFLGGKDPHDVAKYLELLIRASEEAEGSGEFSGGSQDSFWNLSLVLALAATCCRIDGWVSRKAYQIAVERSGGEMAVAPATADSVKTILSPPPRESKAFADWRKFEQEHRPTEADIKLAEEALEYARETLTGRENLSDYEHNLYVATTQSMIPWKLMGICCSLVPFYTKEVSRRSQNSDLEKSQHFGLDCKRLDVYATLHKATNTEGFYGTTYILKFVTREGNVMTWFSSTSPGALKLEIGKEVRMSVTPKGHKEFKGIKETQVSRCTVYSEEGRIEAEAKEAKKASRDAKKAAKLAAIQK
jgi:hypothetical protein